jgi:hypothetical protein
MRLPSRLTGKIFGALNIGPDDNGIVGPDSENIAIPSSPGPVSSESPTCACMSFCQKTLMKRLLKMGSVERYAAMALFGILNVTKAVSGRPLI